MSQHFMQLFSWLNMKEACILLYYSVVVVVSPVFLDKMSQPHQINKTNGETVSYLCVTKSEPAAEIQWFINGEPVDRMYMVSYIFLF